MNDIVNKLKGRGGLIFLAVAVVIERVYIFVRGK